MRLSHDPLKTHASFDDPNLVSRAGLVPVMALAERCGLAGLVREHVTIASRTGVNPDLKVPCLVAGMAAGADDIDDMGVLRHGAMKDLFGGVRAPSTLGSFLRSFTWGNVRQLDAAARQLLVNLAGATPLLPGADVLAFIDMDSMQKRVYGHAKQGAGFGHTKIQGKSLMVRGLNALAAVVSTPLAAPVITATRLRGGKANSARGAASLAAGAISAARQAGCTGQLVFRIDSAYYSAAVLGAIRRGGACFSVTVRMDPRSAPRSPPSARTPGHPSPTRRRSGTRTSSGPSPTPRSPKCPTPRSRVKGQAITARLIVRRVKDLNRKAAQGQDELFTVWRYHALFSDSPFEMIQAEAQHRDHAIVEQVFADLVCGPLAHLPSGHFASSSRRTPYWRQRAQLGQMVSN